MRIVSWHHTLKNMTITIISKHAKAIQKFVKSQMDIEPMKVGFDPWGDTAEKEFERRVTELKRKCLEDPDLHIDVMFYELFNPHFT